MVNSLISETISSLKEKMIRRLEVKFAQVFLVDDFDLQNTTIIEQDPHRLVLKR
jgi:hypothetical protein